MTTRTIREMQASSLRPAPLLARQAAQAPDFSVRQFGSVYHQPTNKDLFIRLDEAHA